MKHETLLLVLINIYVAADAVAEECSSLMYGTTSASTIGVHAGPSWAENSRDAPPIGSATGIWSDGCSGMAGSQFPALVENANGDINIMVEYRLGRLPDPLNQDACARFAHELDGNIVVGGTIEIWQNSYNGGDCFWIMPHVTLDNIIAHELGHVLGLANSNCPNTIMGPDAAVASPSSEECTEVDDAWDQPDEPGDDGGDPEPPQDADSGGCSIAEFPCSPLVLDLNGDGIYTTAAGESPVLFDLNGDGAAHMIGWTDPSTQEGILYYDHNHNRVIDGGAELFGDATILRDGERAANGFEALAAYDRGENGGDGDGVISPSDAVWGKLRLWVDRDHDGAMTQSENHSLGEMHVVEISLSYAETMLVDPQGNRHKQQATFKQRIAGFGWNRIVTRAVHDVYFAAEAR